ncbi:hypothetical protein BX600DRAFT_456211 [Xylariales sp. PMI_506]|nr:hypothetical protein BX600DRAFT_456211 [Xylariales sp. PMI_506]
MANEIAARIHPIYRLWFTWVDPFVTFSTVFLTLTNPDLMMDAMIPAALSARNPDHDFLLHQLAALYAFLGIIITVLLRYTADVGAWKIVQGAILVVDLAILVSLYVSLGQQGRLDPAVWRSSDWANWAITGVVALLRALFLAGVGLKSEGKGKKS